LIREIFQAFFPFSDSAFAAAVMKDSNAFYWIQVFH